MPSFPAASGAAGMGPLPTRTAASRASGELFVSERTARATLFGGLVCVASFFVGLLVLSVSFFGLFVGQPVLHRSVYLVTDLWTLTVCLKQVGFFVLDPQQVVHILLGVSPATQS